MLVSAELKNITANHKDNWTAKNKSPIHQQLILVLET